MHFVAAALALVVTLVSSPHLASATVANDLCPAAADPCNIIADRAVTSESLLDFGTRTVIVKAGKTLDAGSGVMNIRAGLFRLEPKAKLLSAGGFISVTTTGAVEIQAGGADFARIDVSDTFGGGEIDIEAQGPVTVAGDLIAKADDVEADGGDVFISAGGDIVVSRPVSVKGGSDASGGTITYIAGGKLDITASMDASGGEFDGGDIDLTAETNLTVGVNGDFDVSGGSLSGSGGSVELMSNAGNISMGGRVLATAGGSADEGGGFGGSLDATALIGGVSLLDDIDVPGGDGVGAGDGGDINVSAGGAIVVSGNIDSHGGIDASAQHLNGAGGSVFLEGCNVTLIAGRTIDTRGDTFGLNTLRAAGLLQVSGSLLAAQFNVLQYRDPAKPPVVNGTVSPPAQPQQACDIPACAGVNACGNGTVDICESCDPGPDAAGDCCLPSCRFSQLGTPCNGGVCNATGVCGPSVTTTTSTSTTSTSTSTSTTSTSLPGATTTSTTSTSTTSTSTASPSTTITPTTSTTSTTAPPTVCGDASAGQSCDDGDACTEADTCNATGQCVGGTAVSCDDDDVCTDDGVCDRATGCPAPQPKTGFAGVTCRLDAIDAALASAPADELKTSGRKSIGNAVRKARAKLAIASNAPAGKKATKAVKAAQTALRGITRAVNAARRKKTISGTLLGTVQGEANGALGSSQSLLP